MPGPILEMREITKRFPGVAALRSVNLAVKPGEIVCLLGENGAGKSTLMKILAGVHTQYEGTILLEGTPVKFRNTREAFERGISIVYQEFNLCPNLSVMENLFLGNEIRIVPGIVSYRKMREKARAAFRRLKMAIAPDALVKDLGVAQQQMIEVAKALSHNTRVLIMDEPTSALAGREIANLFDIMRMLKRQGISIIFISHKLPEVREISDRVVCLRDGENSGEVNTRDVRENDLVAMMVGREIDRLYSTRSGEPGEEIVLDVRGLSGPPKIRDVSFQVRRGEIVGLAGLIGAGRTEVARLLIGAEKKTGGKVILNGKEISITHPSQAVARKIAYVPEDRKKAGLILPMTVRENITMSSHREVSNRLGVISAVKENAMTDEYISALSIKVSGREQVVRNLSGGNQQKVVISKWLATMPVVLILDEPTRGIDVGAKAEVHAIIAALADTGVAILMISSELPEILHVSDRVLVMHEGRITGDLMRGEATEETIMRAAVS